MLLTLPQRALLVKLYYCNHCNASTAIRMFRTHRKLLKGPLLVNALKAMILKFKETGSLTVRSDIGRNRVSEEIVTDVSTTIIVRSRETLV